MLQIALLEERKGIYINVRSSPLGSGTKIEQVEFVDLNHSIPFIQEIPQNVHQPRCTRKGEYEDVHD